MNYYCIFVSLSLRAYIDLSISALFSQETKIRVFRVLFSSLLCVPLSKQISIYLFRFYFINQTIYIWVGVGLCLSSEPESVLHKKQKSHSLIIFALLCVPLWKQISICLFRLYFINQTIYIWVGGGLCVCPTIQKMFFHTKQKSDFSYFRFCIVVCSPLKTDIDLSISALFY